MDARLTPKASRKPRRKPVDLATTLANQLHLAGITGYLREHHFHPSRQWRIDIAFPIAKLAVECEGVGAHGQPGRHQLTQHLHANTEKHSALAVMGWRLIRVTGRQIATGHALKWIEAAQAGKNGAEAFDVVGKWNDAPRKRIKARKRWTAKDLAAIRSRGHG